ncbi:MAG: Asp-tRNA(Asn)/Glu-tRNA(Gln) amidotransferase GatCAB subunit A [Rhodospirillaceae bacterium]|nr:Asp-tRNA(Asn)/Glu-tRNA(Gln) amidotransferase GatCAB subunit A [Rhodospirillaceae bacterium]
MAALTDLTLAQARDGLVAGEFSSVELTEAHIAATEAVRDLNCYILETPDAARSMAQAADDRRTRGEGGTLNGLPIAIKDLFCTTGVQATAGSRILEGFVPQYESTVTRQLWDAGAVMLGKTNLDEFAMGSSNMTSYFGPVLNPWQRARDPAAKLVPGGSSGGSAAIVAARGALASTGTDTGGSIRQPGAFCGIVGMKPTYGRCSRWGIIAFASSLDQAGPLTRTVQDAAIMLGAMAGHDPKDTTSVNLPVPDYEVGLGGELKGLKVGIPNEYRLDETPAEIDALWQKGIDWLKAAGAEIVEISLPHTKYALPAYYIVAPAEASSNLARYDGVRYGLRVDGTSLQEMYEKTRGVGFGAEVKRRIMIGTYVLSAGYYDAYYLQAQKVRSRIAQDFHEAWEKVDAILTPTTPSAAFAQGDKMDDPIAMYLNDVLTVPASMSGLPAISVPSGLSGDGLPLGLHVIGQPFDEATVFKIGQALEDAANFTATPKLMAGGS